MAFLKYHLLMVSEEVQEREQCYSRGMCISREIGGTGNLRKQENLLGLGDFLTITCAVIRTCIPNWTNEGIEVQRDNDLPMSYS